MPVEDHEHTHSRSKAKRTERNDAKDVKKRKRSIQEDVESPTPKKKHRSSNRSHHVQTPVIPSKAPKGSGPSPFHRQTSSLYLSLPPIAQNHPLQGLCAEHLSPLILTYYPPLQGIILSFHDARLSTTPHQGSVTSGEAALAQTIDEYAAAHVWLTADFLIFRPQRGNKMEGWINLQNEGNIGLVCWNFFTASIERKRLPKNWRWIPGGLDVKRSKKKLKGSEHSDQREADQTAVTPQPKGLIDAQGYFEDGDGRRLGGLIRFTVKDMENSRSSGGDSGFFSIEGTLLDEAQERKLRATEIADEKLRGRRHGREEPGGGYTMSGALVGSSETGDAEEIPEKSPHQ
ncbi:MAG: hypothetical protein L6R39_006212 [Caloplaca ligustica]|nr:MAG: hypothetical protein L6R39_006212 [Caloplaca ligustica]